MIDRIFLGTINDVLVCVNAVDGVELQNDEVHAYVKYVTEKYKRKPNALLITLDGDHASLEPTFRNPSFERIRRITGYLVGTTDRWNNAKKAEEADRVKHGTEGDA
jgi:hypothetical protein